jgi:DnaJ-class molecular chaperone
MAGKDYYLILGVTRSETPAGIRARYRDLVRTLHPDVAGAESTPAFRAVTEAYKVLADPAARRRHNTELATREERLRIQPVSPAAARRPAQPVSLLAEPLAIRPSFEALLERLLRNFTEVGVPKAERAQGLTLEVVLTPDEAVTGVELPIGVPHIVPCAECGGSGRVWLFPCMACGEAGVIAGERVIRISIPPRVRSGSVLELPLDGVGIRNLYLRLYVRIEWIGSQVHVSFLHPQSGQPH